MGYTTDFNGKFTFSRKLTDSERNFLKVFASERHGGSCRHYPGFPGFWCQWVPTADGTALEWDGCEKFYNYTEWLLFLVNTFLKPKGIAIEGSVQWTGEDEGDTGTIFASCGDIGVSGHGEGDVAWSSESGDEVSPKSIADLTAEFLAL